jgi:hypothetical protein
LSIKGYTTYFWAEADPKFYYTGPCESPGCYFGIWSYDLHTVTEKELLSVIPSDNPYNGQFIGQFTVSPDESMLVYHFPPHLYLKKL